MKRFNRIRILKKLLIAVLVFCTISYLSVMFSLLKSVGQLDLKPAINIGFPYKYYYQFWLSGNDSPNCGWIIRNFFLDFILTMLIVFIIDWINLTRSRGS